jgi:MEDS: MEthanogen/methylotroph, DcmR Sensory domain
MAQTVPLGPLGLHVPPGTHICSFYRGTQGRDEIVLPFLAEGIRSQDKCLCILASIDPPDVLARLGQQVDVASSVETGQLELATPANAYLRSGTFSAEDMLDYWLAANETQAEEGFSLIRATGEMPSVLNQPAGRLEFFRYEAKLNEIIPNYAQVILCLYDLDRFGTEVLIDTLRTHPRVVVDGLVHENPYYIEPGKFLARHG